MMLPSLSVITPSFNCAQFIEDAIISVAAQEHQASVEHIVIDGASTDGTVNVLRRYPFVRWSSEKDAGQSDAINKGFQRARGELVGWLNADDYYLPGALQAVARTAYERPEADVIYGDCVFVDSHGRIVRSKVEHTFDRSILMYFGCYIPSTSTFFRRRVIESGFLLDREYGVCMDFEYFVRLAQAGYRFHYLPQFLAAFRWHGNNISVQHAARRAEERLRVQLRYGKHYSESTLQLLATLHRGKRALRKFAEGNLLREIGVRRMMGEDTHWQDKADGRQTCASLASL